MPTPSEIVALAGAGAMARAGADFESALQLLEEKLPEVLRGDLGLPRADGYDLTATT